MLGDIPLKSVRHECQCKFTLEIHTKDTNKQVAVPKRMSKKKADNPFKKDFMC